MSETPAENPNQAAQPGAEEQATQETPAQPQAQAPATAETTDETTYPIRLVRRETGETHWSVANGLWEKVAHAETGEPNAEYVLLATIDGVDVKLGAYNAGRVETIIRAQQQAQQTTQG